MDKVYLLILIIFLSFLINQRKCIEGYISQPDNYNVTPGHGMILEFDDDRYPNNGCDYFIDRDGSTKYYCIDDDINKEKYYLDLSKCKTKSNEGGIYFGDNLDCNLKNEPAESMKNNLDYNVNYDCNSFAFEGNNLNAMCKVTNGMPTSCYNALTTNCSNTDVFKCTECVGPKQQELQKAGCSNDDISKWCANSFKNDSLFYKNSLPINDLGTNQILYDSDNENLYYMNKGNRISASKINLNIPPLKLWGDSIDIEEGSRIACSVNGSCICKMDLCMDGYQWSGVGGEQVCYDINHKEITHKELCKAKDGIFKSKDCFTQDVKCN